jgi:glycosyltransferase involved in cell wall biosynthesis
VDHGDTGAAPGTAPGRGPRLKVLLVIKCLGLGGAERLLVDTVTSGDHGEIDYEVAWVLEAERALVPTLEERGIVAHPLGATRNADMRWMARLRNLLQDGDFDVVHFHLPHTAALGRLVAASMPRARRPAIVYTEHSLWNKMAVLVRVVNRAGIGLDQSLIVVSEAAHEALPRMLRPRARVIVHGVDLTAADAAVAERPAPRSWWRAELGIPDGDLMILTVANLRPEKGYDTLLDAARLVVDRGLPVRFVSVGRGSEEEAMAERHRSLGLGDRFTFLGLREDVLRLLVAADVFVLPSRQEGLPVVLMEATSVGLPIAATAVGGVPQVLTDGVDGLVVAPDSPPDLADAIGRLVEDPLLRDRLGAGAKSRSAMFDVAGASAEIEGIYRDVTAGRRVGTVT